jgi:hypothetical protein
VGGVGVVHRRPDGSGCRSGVGASRGAKQADPGSSSRGLSRRRRTQPAPGVSYAVVLWGVSWFPTWPSCRQSMGLPPVRCALQVRVRERSPQMAGSQIASSWPVGLEV